MSDKLLMMLRGEIKSPPLSVKARRVIYRIDVDAVVVADVFEKKTRATPPQVMQDCNRRLRRYDQAAGG